MSFLGKSMPNKEKTTRLELDDDIAFYKSNSFLVRAMSAIAGDALKVNSDQSPVELLKSIIDDHERSLVVKLNREPLNEMVTLLNHAREKSKNKLKISLEKAPVVFRPHLPQGHELGFEKNYANASMAISSVYSDLNLFWNVHKKNKRNVEVLINSSDRYIPIAAGLILINWLKDSPDHDKAAALLLCMAALIKLDQMKLYALFRSAAYEDYASRRKGKRHSDEYWGRLGPLERAARDMAIAVYKGGERPWHTQLIDPIRNEINKPIIEKIEREVSSLFPKYKTDESENEKYFKEYKKRIRKETLSKKKAKEVILRVSEGWDRDRSPNRRKRKLQTIKLEFPKLDTYDYDEES